MVNTIKLPSLEVVYKDMWVMQPLYRRVRHWLQENNYADPKGDTSMESGMEVLYWCRKGTHMDAHEQEIRILWRTVKRAVPVGTGSNFYKLKIDIDWYIMQMVDKEIMLEGKKAKVQFGEMRILIKPSMDVAEITSTPLLKYFDYWFRTRLIKKNLEENRKILYQDAYELQSNIKRHLDLKSFLPEEEVFHERFDFI